MSLPNKFEFRTHFGDHYQMVRIGGHYYCGELGETVTVYSTQWREEDIQRNLNTTSYGWAITKNLDAPVETVFPERFSFYHAFTTARYDMTKRPNSDLWECAVSGEKAQGALYNAAQIQLNFDQGYWEECSFSEPEERGLVFPLVVDIVGYGVFRIHKDVEGTIWWKEIDTEWRSTVPNLFSEAAIRDFIKGGHWLVQSVGEPAVEKASQYTVKIGNDGCAQGFSITGEATKEATLSLAIKMDSEQMVLATQRAERLTEALEELAISLESVKELMGEFGVSFDVPECVTFCCDN